MDWYLSRRRYTALTKYESSEWLTQEDVDIIRKWDVEAAEGLDFLTSDSAVEKRLGNDLGKILLINMISLNIFAAGVGLHNPYISIPSAVASAGITLFYGSRIIRDQSNINAIRSGEVPQAKAPYPYAGLHDL